MKTGSLYSMFFWIVKKMFTSGTWSSGVLDGFWTWEKVISKMKKDSREEKWVNRFEKKREESNRALKYFVIDRLYLLFLLFLPTTIIKFRHAFWQNNCRCFFKLFGRSKPNYNKFNETKVISKSPVHLLEAFQTHDVSNLLFLTLHHPIAF